MKASLVTGGAALVVALAAAGDAAAAPRYVATPLGTLGGAYAEGLAINASGQVAGLAQLASGIWHPFVHAGGVMRDVDPDGGNGGVAFAINVRGDATGCATSPEGKRFPVVWRDGRVDDLQALAGDDNLGCGAAINASGDVVGHRRFGETDYFPPHSYRYSNGVVTDVPHSGVAAMNDAGSIAGTDYALTRYGWPPTGWKCDGADCTGFPLPNSGRASSATAINARGHVAGSAEVETYHSYPVIFADGALRVLGPGAGIGVAINIRDEVVGRAEFDVDVRPFLFTNGAIHELNALVTSGLDGAVLTEAKAINDDGVIVANSCVEFGTETLCKAFRLDPAADPGNPVPALSPWAIAALAAALVFAGVASVRGTR